jgi:hypothetical protein
MADEMVGRRKSSCTLIIGNGLKTTEHNKGAAKIFAKNKKFIDSTTEKTFHCRVRLKHSRNSLL